jgi:hypothetical protein
VLAAFMEERNILWGELVGGLLIVGCSIALVISLWKTLEEIPYFPFLIMAGITAALFGAGLYTLHHWKLESTSRGLLVIATLLIPLNFLIMAAFAMEEQTGLLTILINGASLALFGWLLYLAGRVLVPDARRLLPLAILGASASQLLVPVLVKDAEPGLGPFVLLGALPLTFFGLGAGRLAARTAREEALSERRVKSLFGFLGLAAFALLVALGFLVGFLLDRGGSIGWALNRLSVVLALAGVPVLAVGLVVHRRLESAAWTPSVPASLPGETAAATPAETLAGFRTLGTGVTLTGIAVMLAGVVLAWPQPAALVLVCALDVAVLTAVALRFRLPLAHAAALPCLVVGYLTAFHWLSGALADTPEADLGRRLMDLTVYSWGGTALMVLALILAGAAEVCARVGRRLDAVYFALEGLAVALLSWGLVTGRGLTYPERAALVSAVYAAGTLALNARWRRPAVTYLGLTLALAATVWGMEWQWPVLGRTPDGPWPESLPLWSALLAVQALAMGLLALALAMKFDREAAGSGGGESFSLWGVVPFPAYLTRPLARAGEWLAWPVIGLGVWAGLLTSWQFEYVITGGCLCGLFATLAAWQRGVGLARIAGVLLIGTVVAVTGWAGTAAEAPNLAALLALSVAGISTVMAAVSVWVTHRLRGPAAPPEGSATAPPAWYGVFALAWRETSALAAGLGLVLALASETFTAGIELHALALALLAATAFLLAWRYQTPLLTWAGSALALGAILHALSWNAFGLVLRHPFPVGLLAHATLAVLAGLVVWARTPEGAARPSRIFAGPLLDSGLATAVSALPLLLVVPAGQPLYFAGYTGWLATVWLVIAWVRRWPALFTAYQAALTLALLYAVTAWIQRPRQGWDLWDPRSLQAYGIGLTALALVWLVVRLGLRSDTQAQELLEPRWPALDRLVLGAVVVGQLILAGWGIIPGITRELTALGTPPPVEMWPEEYPWAYSLVGWALLGGLAVVLAVALWDRMQAATVLGWVVLAATVPVLGAGQFDLEKATASALRWGLAIAFLFLGALVWLRVPLARWAARLGISVEAPWPLAQVVQGLLLGGLVLPVLILTEQGAGLRFLGERPAGPGAETFFAQVGALASSAVPLALVSLGLVGFALRERSSAHAFAAGLIATLTLMGGYALEAVRDSGVVSPADTVRVWQLGAAGAAAWALAWLAGRRWVRAWREEPDAPLARPLMAVQVGMSLVVNGGLLLAGLAALVLAFPVDSLGAEEVVYARAPAWVLEVGSVLGWLALALAALAGFLRRWPNRVGFSSHTFCGLVLAELVLLACTLERLGPAWGYRTLLLGCGAGALALSLGAWSLEGRTRLEKRFQMPSPTAMFWVRVAGALVLFLAVKAAVWHQDHLWAAAALALVSLAGAVQAVWHRREDWAFLAGLGVNLAASLVVWHQHRHRLLDDWWVVLVQANVIANAAGTLFWLGVRRWLYAPADLVRSSGPLLALQVALGFVGNAVLLVVPLNYLLVQPEALPGDLVRVGEVWGWAALVLAMVAAVWYLGQVAARLGAHLVGGLGLALGVLLACTASRWDRGDWLSYHVLTASWTAVGMAFFLCGWWLAPRSEGGEAPGVPANPALRLVHISLVHVLGWVTGIGVAVVFLALRGTWDDPARPYWSAGATLAVSVLAGALALWSRWQVYVFGSGLLANLAALMVWVTWGPGTLSSFLYVVILGLGVTAAVWSIPEWALAWRPWARGRPGRGVSYSHLGALLGLGILAAVVAAAVAYNLRPEDVQFATPLGWAAVAATALALVVSLWDDRAKFPVGGLYVAGLAALGLALHAPFYPPRELGWWAALALAGYVLLTSALGRVLPRLHGLWRVLRLPARPASWPEAWFLPAQAVAAALVATLSVWMSIDFARADECLAGPLAVALLLPAGVLLTGSLAEGGANLLRLATLALSVAAVTEVGWALLDLDPTVLPAPWLHREVLLMAVLAGLTFVYGVGMARLLPQASAWRESFRRLAPWLGALAVVMMAVVLVHEGLLFDPEVKKTPMQWPGVLAVGLGLVVLIISGLVFAVAPGRDPLGLSERKRTLYVYGCELLLVLIFVHVRLNVPQLFGGWGARYWTLMIMAIAFAGVGLGEYFTRKGLAVLAEPLYRTGIFLPLLPLLAFWVQPAAPLPGAAPQEAPAAGRGFGTYALVWYALGGLYALVALTRRSFWYAFFAALAINFGLWSMLYSYGWQFLAHPQLWLIPLALILLVSEHVNRDRLSRGQATALRYLALGVLYLSSTADMFITGLGNSVILPLVLAGLSVLGVLAGILLRVRAFLFLGVAFLFLDIFAMIWHAAVDRTQTWVWWASGVVLGVAIVALFAVFEKRRNDVLKLIDEIKKWS